LELFEAFSKLMDILDTNWRIVLLSMASDGAPNMTGQHQGMLTRVQEVAGPGFIRVWCGTHQYDLKIEDFMPCFLAMYGIET
jgi:hypothetical protein